MLANPIRFNSTPNHTKRDDELTQPTALLQRYNAVSAALLLHSLLPTVAVLSLHWLTFDGELASVFGECERYWPVVCLLSTFTFFQCKALLLLSLSAYTSLHDSVCLQLFFFCINFVFANSLPIVLLSAALTLFVLLFTLHCINATFWFNRNLSKFNAKWKWQC